MSDPQGGTLYNAGEEHIADWDEGTRHGGTTNVETGHHSVYGTVDGEHYHRSWEADGSRDHSTLNKDSDWHINHDND